jgi:hypothetical protein
MSVNYEEVLADLRQVKADAEAGITAIERLMARNGIARGLKVELPGTASTGGHIGSPKPWNDTSVPQQVGRFLGGQPGKSFTIAEIIEGIGVQNIPTLRGALGRMVKRGEIAKQGRGRYRTPRRNATAEPYTFKADDSIGPSS